jgi:uncharacterized protein (TIGR04255 family)
MLERTPSPEPLAHPPAVEVIYGLQAVTPTDLEWEAVQEVLQQVLPIGFRVDQQIANVNIEVKTVPGAEPAQTRTETWSGVKVVSEDGQVTGHLMRFGLFVNFSQYGGYDAAIGSVQALWKAYFQAFRSALVMQLTIRYINVIRLPFDKDGRVELTDYLHVAIQFPEALARNLTNFHYQFTIVSDEGLPARIMLSSMREEADDLVMAFDNEGAYKSQWRVNDENIWTSFTKVRDWTYHIYQTVLTEKCREEIKG